MGIAGVAAIWPSCASISDLTFFCRHWGKGAISQSDCLGHADEIAVDPVDESRAAVPDEIGNDQLSQHVAFAAGALVRATFGRARRTARATSRHPTRPRRARAP